MSDEVICERAEICTQRLVVCEHQKLHSVKNLLLNPGNKLLCTTVGFCAGAEIDCKCIKKVR